MGNGNGKFGLGARVCHVGGASGEVIDKRKGERLVKYDALSDPIWARKVDLTVVEAWVPKVGDRVVWAEKFDSAMYTKGKEYLVHRENGPVIYVTDDTDDNLDHSWDAESIREHFTLAPLPVAQPPITIRQHFDSISPTTWAPVAGKFGKTRDGRKVGPMRNEGWSDGYKWTADYMSWYVNDNGEGQGGDDLISEWPAEVAEPTPVAVSPATATKFKVGDLVRMVKKVDGEITDCPATIKFDDGDSSINLAIEFDREHGWAHEAGDHAQRNRGWWVSDTDIELVDTPKFKVGDRVNFTLTRTGWQGVVIDKINDNGTYSGLEPGTGYRGAFYENQIELATPPLAIGNTVTLAAPARITGFHAGNANLVLAGGVSFNLPVAELVAA